MNETYDSEPARRLLLLAADWQTRTLTLAELQTRGYDVKALPGITWGIKALVQRRIEPALVVLDTKDDADVTPERVRDLIRMLPNVPIILIVTTFARSAYEPLRERVATLLVRPITIGDVVAAVVREVGAP